MLCDCTDIYNYYNSVSWAFACTPTLWLNSTTSPSGLSPLVLCQPPSPFPPAHARSNTDAAGYLQQQQWKMLQTDSDVASSLSTHIQNRMSATLMRPAHAMALEEEGPLTGVRTGESGLCEPCNLQVWMCACREGAPPPTFGPPPAMQTVPGMHTYLDTTSCNVQPDPFRFSSGSQCRRTWTRPKVQFYGVQVQVQEKSRTRPKVQFKVQGNLP